MLRLRMMGYALCLGVMWSSMVFADDRHQSGHCDANAPQSLDGGCNNLRFPRLGAVDTPLLYLAGQHYARVLSNALHDMPSAFQHWAFY